MHPDAGEEFDPVAVASAIMRAGLGDDVIAAAAALRMWRRLGGQVDPKHDGK